MKEKAPPPSSKPAKSGDGKQKKKKWSKGKQKENVNNMVLFDHTRLPMTSTLPRLPNIQAHHSFYPVRSYEDQWRSGPESNQRIDGKRFIQDGFCPF